MTKGVPIETDALSKWQGWGIPVLRVVVGVVFLAHGVQKLFVRGFGNLAAFLSRFGIPALMLAAVIVTLVEFLGGLMLILGLYTRWAAAPLAIDMLVAILTIHFRNGFFLPSGFEFPPDPPLGHRRLGPAGVG